MTKTLKSILINLLRNTIFYAGALLLPGVVWIFAKLQEALTLPVLIGAVIAIPISIIVLKTTIKGSIKYYYWFLLVLLVCALVALFVPINLASLPLGAIALGYYLLIIISILISVVVTLVKATKGK